MANADAMKALKAVVGDRIELLRFYLDLAADNDNSGPYGTDPSLNHVSHIVRAVLSSTTPPPLNPEDMPVVAQLRHLARLPSLDEQYSYLVACIPRVGTLDSSRDNLGDLSAMQRRFGSRLYVPTPSRLRRRNSPLLRSIVPTLRAIDEAVGHIVGPHSESREPLARTNFAYSVARLHVMRECGFDADNDPVRPAI